MNSTIIVFIGAGIGGVLRYGVNLVAPKWFGLSFPAGTMLINVVGSGVMGLVAGWLSLRTEVGWSLHARLFVMTGILGGFTTFSAFSLDAFQLWARGETGLALAYVVGSVALSLAALALGFTLVRGL